MLVVLRLLTPLSFLGGPLLIDLDLEQLEMWSPLLLVQLYLGHRLWWAFLPLIVIAGVRLVARALGWLPVDYLRFDADCLTLGRRRYMLHVPWSNIAAALPGETKGFVAVYISLREHANWTTTPLAQRGRAEAALKRDARWNGAPIVISPARYGVETFPLVQVLQDEIARAAH
jgi:hypothetical protein